MLGLRFGATGDTYFEVIEVQTRAGVAISPIVVQPNFDFQAGL